MEQIPVQITFRHMEGSPALEEKIRAHADELTNFFHGIVRCEVLIERTQHRHQQGDIFRVLVHLVIPGNDIIVSRERGKDHGHEDPYVTVRDAFDAARRQVQDRARRSSDHPKKEHAAPPHGRITEVIPMEDYGRFQTADGRDIYFHRNSLLNATLDDLEIGQEVRFSEEMGENGPQASSVWLVEKRGARSTHTSVSS